MFIAKLAPSPTGTFRPVYSTYLGGSYTDANWENWFTDWGLDIAVEDGVAYVAGSTWSNDFPTTAGAYDTTFNGPATSPDWSPPRPGSDAVIVKLDGSGNLAYSTYLGGSGYDVPGDGRGGGDDVAMGIAVQNGIVYAAGWTKSSDFPTTSGAYDRTYANVDIGLNTDVFVVKLNPAGNGSADLLYGTFVGGGLEEEGYDIAVDGSGIVYITGYARGHPYDPTMNSDFPTTSGAFDRELKGDNWDALFFKMNPAGNGTADLLYSTFLGVDTDSESGKWALDRGYAIAVDGMGNAYIVGKTDSDDFPTTEGAFQRNRGGLDDLFVAKLHPGGNGAADLLYSTFLGGRRIDGWSGADIALDDQGDVYLTGDTFSDDFPVTADAYDATYNYVDAFVVRLRPQGQEQDDLIYSTYIGGNDDDEGLGIAVESEGLVWVAGRTESSNFPTTEDAFDRLYNGNGDGFIVQMAAPARPELSSSTKRVAPEVASTGEVVTFTVRLVNSGLVSATVAFTDTLPTSLILQGTPTVSSGITPTVSGQVITWTGAVDAGEVVTIAYTAQVTATGTLVPPLINQALIDDGQGHVYVRRAFVNGYHVYLPLVLR
ncbi:MAG: DUF11 domain-containing protein [Chloroflexi bacterium]|nr:MAG: DUF11 domain-containing protein [Chloroflexota bacterium]